MDHLGLHHPLQSQLLNMQGAQQSSRMAQLRQTYANPDGADHKKLKQAAQEFEAIFVQQLLDAMDKTVDRENSILSGGSSEQYFRGMLHEEIAKSMTTGLGGSGFGLAEAIYRQAAENLPTPIQPGSSATPSSSESQPGGAS